MQASLGPPLYRASVWLWTTIALLSCAAFAGAYAWYLGKGYARLDTEATERLNLYAAHITSELAGHRYVPGILELDGEVMKLVSADSAEPSDIENANRKLAITNAKVGVKSLFVLDAGGKAIAASNWYSPESMIGTSFADSAIYSEAIATGSAGSFVANNATNSPEYYFSKLIRVDGKPRGVAVAQISLEPLLATWIEGGASTGADQILVSDENRVIVLSSIRDWMFRPIRVQDERAETSVNPDGSAVTLITKRQLQFGASVVGLPLGSHGTQNESRIAVTHTKRLSQPPWTLMTLTSISQLRTSALNAGFAGASLTVSAGLIALYWAKRRREISYRLATRELLQKANDELGLRVDERTKQLADTNHRLVLEIGERERAEESLRQTLDELIQAGKMASLGQMATGIAHEINQPLTALLALSHNTQLLMEREKIDAARSNLKTISDITSRISRITAQLKSFGRKGPAFHEAVNLSQAVESSLLLLDNRLKEHGIDTRIRVPMTLQVVCDRVRLEQVIVNLMANSIDALSAWTGKKQLHVTATENGDRTKVIVGDTGKGIAQEIRHRLFEPFFTTKPTGKGLGLGLVISASIISEFGGTLATVDTGEGAAFSFDLKKFEGPSA